MRFGPEASVTDVEPLDWMMVAPAMSLSTSVTMTLVERLLYLVSVEVAVWVMVALRLPVWSTLSSTPVTVTVCAVFQLEVLNVNEEGLTVATVVLLDVTATLTLAEGWLASFTV